MQKQLFERLIICSNEKSIITNNAGFGVRTVSSGLPYELALKIFNEVKTIYDVPVSRRVTSRQLREDPSIVCKYPRTYRQGTYVFDGKKYFIASCSTYVGVDYGYFCNKENASRAGTNYVSDVLISERPITSTVWALAAKKQLFIPKDNTALPSNLELKKLLTGEPKLIPPYEVNLPHYDNIANLLNDTQKMIFCDLLIAILQTKINRDCKKEDSLCRLMILAPDIKTDDFLLALALIPNEIVSEISFETNYLNGHGMPENCNLVIINEYNTEETYSESYVLLDLNKSTPKLQNVSNNVIFEEIKSLVKKEDFANASALASYIYAMTIQTNTDYETLRRAFLLIETNLPFDYKIIDVSFLKTMSKANLSSECQKKLEYVVSKKFNDEIQNNNQLETVLAWINNVWSSFKSFFTITEQNRHKLTDLWLGGKLVDHVAKYGEAFIANCLQTTFSSERMLNALRLSDNVFTWKYFLNLTYGRSLSEYFFSVISAILNSKLTVQKRQQLIGEMFPIGASTSKNYKDLFKTVPDIITEFEDLFTKVCLSDKETMIYFAKNSTSIDVIDRVLDKYILGNSLHVNPSNLSICIKRLQEIHSYLGKEHLAIQKLEAPNKIRSVIFSAPEKVKSADILALENLPCFKADKEDFIVIRTIIDCNLIPNDWRTVTTENLELAIKLNKDAAFIDSMYSLWLNNDDKKDPAMFVKDANIKGYERQSKILLITWSHRFNQCDIIKSYINTLITIFKWGDSYKVKFIKQCDDMELSKLITMRLSLWRKLLLKLFSSKKHKE